MQLMIFKENICNIVQYSQICSIKALLFCTSFLYDILIHKDAGVYDRK